MRNRTYGGVRGRKTKVGEKLLRFPPTRFMGVLVSYAFVMRLFIAYMQHICNTTKK